MKILITNDDGIESPVLAILADAVSQEHEVMVVAPATDQSGMSQAFTHGADRLLGYRMESASPYPLYQVSGTPADCIKFAVGHLLGDRKMDLVLSGINLGENAGMSTVYSGTVAAAREGAMWGMPSLALSIWKNTPAHLDYAIRFLMGLLRDPSLLPSPQARANGTGALWNINFPACAPDKVEGVEITSMSTVMFVDSYEPVLSRHGITQFRLVGYKPPERFREGTDDYALARNRIAITPLQVDQSDQGERLRLAALGSRWNSL